MYGFFIFAEEDDFHFDICNCELFTLDSNEFESETSMKKLSSFFFLLMLN